MPPPPILLLSFTLPFLIVAAAPSEYDLVLPDDTLYTFIFSKRHVTLDKTRTDFDILRRLFQHTGSVDQLRNPVSKTGLSLFAPSDHAFLQTALDIHTLLDAPRAKRPVSESDVYDVLVNRWFSRYQDPKDALLQTLLYHIFPPELSRIDLFQRVSYRSVNGFEITRLGDSFQHQNLQFPNPSISFDYLGIKTSNGVVHVIDRMLFLNDSQFQLAKPSVKPISPSSPHKKRPTKLTQTPSPSVTSSPAPLPSQPSFNPSPPLPTSDPFPPIPSLPAPSEDTLPDDDPACFPSQSLVHLSDASTVRMKNLSPKHSLLIPHSPPTRIYLFSHNLPNTFALYLRITTSKNHTLHISPNHYLYTSVSLLAAHAVTPGTYLRTLHGLASVTSVRRVYKRGVYAPHTLQGDLVVDGILVSSYSTAVSPNLAHALLGPIRALTQCTRVLEPLGQWLYSGAPRALLSYIPSGRLLYS